jgi:hypothetical protein
MKKLFTLFFLVLIMCVPAFLIFGVEKNCRDLDNCRNSSDGCDAYKWTGCWIDCYNNTFQDCSKSGGGGDGPPGPVE